MAAVHEYRAKANEFLAKAKLETDPLLRSEYRQLGQSYLRLAEQADRNRRSDLVYETPPRETPRQQQQQQQIQPPKADRSPDD
jgi:hypothetical protein